MKKISIALVMILIMSSLVLADKAQLKKDIQDISDQIDIPAEQLYARMYQESKGKQFATSGWSAGISQFVWSTAEDFEPLTDECWEEAWKKEVKESSWSQLNNEDTFFSIMTEAYNDCAKDDYRYSIKDVSDARTWIPQVDWRYDRKRALINGAKYFKWISERSPISQIQDEQLKWALTHRAYHSGLGTVTQAIKLASDPNDHTSIMMALSDTDFAKKYTWVPCEACKDWNLVRKHLEDYNDGKMPEGVPEAINCAQMGCGDSVSNNDNGDIIITSGGQQYVYVRTKTKAIDFASCVYSYESSSGTYYYRIDGKRVDQDGNLIGGESSMIGKTVTVEEKNPCGDLPPEKYQITSKEENLEVDDPYGNIIEYDIHEDKDGNEYYCNEDECTNKEGQLTDRKGNLIEGRSKIIGRKVTMEKKDVKNFGYVVRPGDTLWNIAKIFIISSGIKDPSSKQIQLKVDKIIAENNLEDPDDISVGQQLTIYPVYDMCNIADKRYPETIDHEYGDFMEYCEYLQCKEGRGDIRSENGLVRIGIIHSRIAPSSYLNGADVSVIYNEYDNTFHLKGNDLVYPIADILRNSGILQHTRQYPCLGFKKIYDNIETIEN